MASKEQPAVVVPKNSVSLAKYIEPRGYMIGRDSPDIPPITRGGDLKVYRASTRDVHVGHLTGGSNLGQPKTDGWRNLDTRNPKHK